MEKSLRTDLAAEARDLWQKGRNMTLPGLVTERQQHQGFMVDLVEIQTEEAAKELCKPKGRYVTVELDALIRREEDAFPRGCDVLAQELRRQLQLEPWNSVLVVGLGNPDITPDALGPLAADHVLVTRHLRERLGEDFAGLRPVSVFRSGVLGTTGVESAELTAAVAERIRPDRIIAVDALAALQVSRLCKAVQISDTGIVPGSGVGNARSALTAETLGAPVIVVGVPTVVDAATLCADLTGGEPPAEAKDMFVTPRNIDSRVRDVARLVGYAIDLALQEDMSLEEVEMYLG